VLLIYPLVSGVKGAFIHRYICNAIAPQLPVCTVGKKSVGKHPVRHSSHNSVCLNLSHLRLIRRGIDHLTRSTRQRDSVPRVDLRGSLVHTTSTKVCKW